MTDKAHENIKTGDKAERQEQLSPAKAGENQITKKADFSKAFQTAHAHDSTLSGTHDAAFEIVDGSSTLVSSRKQEQKPDSRSEAYLKSVKNPTADALYEMRKNIDKLPPGPQKDNALTEARKTQKEMFPASYEHTPDDNDGGTFKALTPDSPQPFTVGERSDGGMLIKTGVETKHIAEPPPPNFMAAMTPEMRAGIIKAFQGAPAVADQSLNATTDDILKQTAEGYIDVVKFPVDVTVAACKGLWGILEFERDLMIDPERAQKTAATAGDYIGKALVAGVKLWAGGSEYASQVSQSGDYRRPFQDLGNAINKWYDGLTPGDQMHVMASISGGFGLSAAAGQLRQLAKPGAFVQFMEEAAQTVPKNPEAQQRAAETVKKLIESFSKSPVGKLATVDGPAVDATEDMNTLFSKRFVADGKKDLHYATEPAKRLEKTAKEVREMSDRDLEKHGWARIEHYRDSFFKEYPELKATKGIHVHHAIEQQVLERYPGLFTPQEINDVKMLRGIPNKLNSDLHNSRIRKEWNDFYEKYPPGKATREDFLRKAKEIDDKLGKDFLPKGKWGTRK